MNSFTKGSSKSTTSSSSGGGSGGGSVSRETMATHANDADTARSQLPRSSSSSSSSSSASMAGAHSSSFFRLAHPASPSVSRLNSSDSRDYHDGGGFPFHSPEKRPTALRRADFVSGVNVGNMGVRSGGSTSPVPTGGSVRRHTRGLSGSSIRSISSSNAGGGSHSPRFGSRGSLSRADSGRSAGSSTGVGTGEFDGTLSRSNSISRLSAFGMVSATDARDYESREGAFRSQRVGNGGGVPVFQSRRPIDLDLHAESGDSADSSGFDGDGVFIDAESDCEEVKEDHCMSVLCTEAVHMINCFVGI